MYILVEFEELKAIIQKIHGDIYPDLPVDELATYKETLDRTTEVLDVILGQQQEIADDMTAVFNDDEIYTAAVAVVTQLVKRLALMGTLEWLRVIDNYGGVVIRLKPFGAENAIK